MTLSDVPHADQADLVGKQLILHDQVILLCIHLSDGEVWFAYPSQIFDIVPGQLVVVAHLGPDIQHTSVTGTDPVDLDTILTFLYIF